MKRTRRMEDRSSKSSLSPSLVFTIWSSGDLVSEDDSDNWTFFTNNTSSSSFQSHLHLDRLYPPQASRENSLEGDKNHESQDNSMPSRLFRKSSKKCSSSPGSTATNSSSHWSRLKQVVRFLKWKPSAPEILRTQGEEEQNQLDHSFRHFSIVSKFDGLTFEVGSPSVARLEPDDDVTNNLDDTVVRLDSRRPSLPCACCSNQELEKTNYEDKFRQNIPLDSAKTWNEGWADIVSVADKVLEDILRSRGEPGNKNTQSFAFRNAVPRSDSAFEYRPCKRTQPLMSYYSLDSLIVSQEQKMNLKMNTSLQCLQPTVIPPEKTFIKKSEPIRVQLSFRRQSCGQRVWTNQRKLSLKKREYKLRLKLSNKDRVEKERICENQTYHDHEMPSSNSVAKYLSSPVMARELTRVQCELFNGITATELSLYLLCPNAASEETCPAISEVLAFERRLVNLIVTSVLSQEAQDDQRRLVNLFVDVAAYLRGICNWSGFGVVRDALRSPPLARLSNLWGSVRELSPCHFDEMLLIIRTELTDTDREPGLPMFEHLCANVLRRYKASERSNSVAVDVQSPEELATKTEVVQFSSSYILKPAMKVPRKRLFLGCFSFSFPVFTKGNQVKEPLNNYQAVVVSRELKENAGTVIEQNQGLPSNDCVRSEKNSEHGHIESLHVMATALGRWKSAILSYKKQLLEENSSSNSGLAHLFLLYEKGNSMDQNMHRSWKIESRHN